MGRRRPPDPQPTPQATEAVITVSRSPLAQGRSFILKTSTFTAAMAEAGLTLTTSLKYQDGGIYFDASFWPAGYNGRREDELCVRPGNVRSAVAFEARRHVEAVVLPELIAWVQQVQGRNWKQGLPFNCPRPPEFHD
ncbi:hypothetical protein [Deinococcus yunweiensis]|uniref:hypothetical protein n=1 Tax=Deinococcus yunweiensis TaxID=367282 RepID=UPI00398E4F2A